MKQPKPEQYHKKKRHTEDQFPYNTYLCTIPDDFTEVPVHWHEEAELIVIQKGSGTVLVDLTHYHVAAGDIIIVLPEHLHAIREISGQKMEYENIIFRPELSRNKIPPITFFIIFHKNTIHNHWNLTFIRFKQNNQILHSTVSGTDIHFSDLLLDGLFHTRQSFFDAFNMYSTLR